MSKIFKTGISVFSLFLIWVIYELCLPTLSMNHFGGFAFISFVLILIGANIYFWTNDGIEGKSFPLLIILVLIVVVLIIGLFAGSSLFNSNKMYKQLGTPTEINFDKLIKQMDNSQIPIVDDPFATKQADKRIGEETSLGSRVNLGDAVIQDVNGEIIYVAPLEHSGFFKWNKHQSTPGYITVSATNATKVNFVKELNGKPIEINYQKSAYFGKDLKRHIRNSGYTNVGLTEYTFELNDTGYPYWVVTTYKNTRFWAGGEATGVIIVDAQTGDIEFYEMNSIPDWVDIVQPKQFIENQINNFGKLIHGIFNFSGTDKLKKTDKTLVIYANGDCYYFTGMTSVGSDNSCVGFLMVNTRDKSSYMCYMSGATEDAAMASAEGIVSDFGYTSTEPLPINVNGIPTYVMALKDAEGLVKSYAMVNIESYNIVSKGDTLKDASKAYIQLCAKSGANSVVSSDEAYGYTVEGTVSRISSVIEDGSTYYYILLNNNNKIFVSSHTISDELSLTRDGDTVKISYIDDSNGTVDITEFDNLLFSDLISSEQQKRNELDKETNKTDSVTQVNPEANENAWNSLTPEEKSKLLEKLNK